MKKEILFTSLLAALLFWSFCGSAFGDDGDLIPDTEEAYIAEIFKPILHKHPQDKQAGLANITEWVSSGAHVYQGGWNSLGQWVQTLYYYNWNGYWHQNFVNFVQYAGDDAIACSYGYNEFAPTPRSIRLGFAPERKYQAAQNKVVYYHVKYVSSSVYYLEYWYFLGYNDLRYDDQTIQEVWHEGDWEHVAIKLDVTPGTPHGTYVPDLVNFYQHLGGYTRDPADCWWTGDNGQTPKQLSFNFIFQGCVGQ